MARLQRAGTKLHIVSFRCHECLGFSINNKLISKRFYALIQAFQLDIDNLFDSIQRKLVESNNLCRHGSETQGQTTYSKPLYHAT